MNKRILKLKQQAEAYVDSIDNGIGIEEYRKLLDQKFAELIVKECADIANQWQVSEHPGLLVRDVIKKHFGVEE
jgi:hypothetical protein